MHFLSRKKHGLTSQSTQQPETRPVRVCPWSAHAPHSAPHSEPSPSLFPRDDHTLTATATSAGELFLFGGDAADRIPSNDVYAFSTRDFSTTLLKTSGEVPTPRRAHGSVLIDTRLLICGGKTGSGDQNVLNHDSLYLLNLESREWARVVVNSPGPNSRIYHTTTVVGSKLFVFGGRIGGKVFNDMWTLDLDSLQWELYEPTPGNDSNEKPLPRAAHVSVTTEDHDIIIFGGRGDQRHFYNDTWSFDISTRKWTKLQCTGSTPSPRACHAAVLVDDVMYVFGGSTGKTYLGDLYALQLPTRRWFKFHNKGPSPHRRSAHAMASDGTRVFVLGGNSEGARADEISLIHVFDTKHIKYPEPEPNPVSGHASLRITHERNPDPNGRPLGLTGVNSEPRRVPEDDASEGSTEHHRNFATPYSSSSEVADLERQLLSLLAAQTERDQRIARLTALLEQSEANAAEAAKRAGLHAARLDTEVADRERQLLALLAAQTERDQRIARLTALLERPEANAAEAAKCAGLHAARLDTEVADMQTRLDEVPSSCDDQRYGAELANVRAKLKAKESELVAVHLRLTDAEDGWAKSRAKADTLHTVTAASQVDLNEDRAMCEHKEDNQVMEAEVASLECNENARK